MASKVYFADLRADVHENLQQKLTRLMKTAGMGDIDFRDKFVAIKLHFGEPGNLAFLRPNWARTVADFVKERGGKPFLTDCNTLYVGGRKNALDHMDSAMLNGFNPMTTGCQIIIGDGLKGSDEVEVPVVGGEYVKNAKIGRAVMDADVFISLTHFKGHEEAGFGGCLKNIGMGCGRRAEQQGRTGQYSFHGGGDWVLCVGLFGLVFLFVATDQVEEQGQQQGKAPASGYPRYPPVVGRRQGIDECEESADYGIGNDVAREAACESGAAVVAGSLYRLHGFWFVSGARFVFLMQI